MQNLLTSTNRLLDKLGPVSQLIDTLAERLVPGMKAWAGCAHCVNSCGSWCGRRTGYTLWLHCYDPCSGDPGYWVNKGCNC